jgi:hypothetical protein
LYRTDTKTIAACRGGEKKAGEDEFKSPSYILEEACLVMMICGMALCSERTATLTKPYLQVAVADQLRDSIADAVEAVVENQRQLLLKAIFQQFMLLMEWVFCRHDLCRIFVPADGDAVFQVGHLFSPHCWRNLLITYAPALTPYHRTARYVPPVCCRSTWT